MTFKLIWHGAIIAVLTALSQLGGVAWLVALLFRRRVLAFLVLYVGLSLAALWVAPTLGRQPLSCVKDGPVYVQSWLYCALNRTYVTPELAGVLADLSEDLERSYPGTKLLVLDANFPFLDRFPLLPHLSHHDGRKLDLAFFYADETGYLPGVTRSPLGYFAFEEGPTDCPKAWPTLRWDFAGLQPFWPDLTLEPDRTTHVLRWLTEDPRVGKIFVEPHLKRRLGLSSDKLRFQGCRAARHDDHIHFQL